MRRSVLAAAVRPEPSLLACRRACVRLTNRVGHPRGSRTLKAACRGAQRQRRRRHGAAGCRLSEEAAAHRGA
eukprot:272743-Chlamydomonas_euryale.AAC.5